MLHADHEQNASTSTVRIAGSSKANPSACVAAGIASLWGPAHGGANEAVSRDGGDRRMPQTSRTRRAKDRNDPFRLMGFGHRLYKTVDPRATLMRDMCHNLLSHLRSSDPLLALAMELEKLASQDDTSPREDCTRTSIFTVAYVSERWATPEHVRPAAAVARSVGWISQWCEMAGEKPQRISRPRQMYVGSSERRFVPVAERGDEGDEGDDRDGPSARWIPWKGGSWTCVSRCHDRDVFASVDN